MKNLTTYENYGTSEIQENWDMQKESSCMSEESKMQLEKLCNEYLSNEAKAYHDDENPDHTYEGYVNECGNYMKECMGRPGYSSLYKPYAG